MLRYVVAALCGISLTGSVYMAGWGNCGENNSMAGTCCDSDAPVAKTAAVSKEVAAKIPDGVTDVKNTKCVVMGDDLAGSTKFVVYEGKAYHICCPDCVKTFEKDPTKYVKALEGDPAKFGLAKAAN